MGAERWRNATCQGSGATPDTGGGKVSGIECGTVVVRWERWFMDHSIKPKGLACFSILLLILAVSPAAYGQAAPTASAEQIQALQKKLDALQSQMAEVQGEIQRLSGSSGQPPSREVTDLKSEIQAEQQSETSQVETELTPKKIELGKATVTYRVFSQDPFAAPRINNEPLDPRFPGYFRLSRYKYAHAHRRIRQDRLHLRFEARGKYRQLHPSDHPHPGSPRALTTRPSPYGRHA